MHASVLSHVWHLIKSISLLIVEQISQICCFGIIIIDYQNIMINFHHKKLSIWVDLILMDFLYERLPKDLVNIIEEYAKDRTNYDKLIQDYQELLDKSYVIGQIFEISNNKYRFEILREAQYFLAIRKLKEHQVWLKSLSMNRL
jgi:hypothetical protein